MPEALDIERANGFFMAQLGAAIGLVGALVLIAALAWLSKDNS